MKEPIPLTEWFPLGTRLGGTLPEGKTIRTSQIMSREGLIVITRSGSRYKLVSPVPDAVELDHIDAIIKINNEHPK